MSKLSPKPKTTVKKLTWKDLDELLIANFENSSEEVPSVTIELNRYGMSKSEIISEATNKGYSVSEPAHGFLEFK